VANCQACGHEIPSGSRFCPECGAPSPGVPSGSASDARIQPILAAANLLRMRGRWEEAIGKCVEAMRTSPNNATAHALIGDIYSEQGRDADALQWYQMALELDPDNAHDKAKVEALLAKLDATSAEPVSREELLKSLPGPSSESPKGNTRALWAIALVAVAVLLVVAAIKYLPGGRSAPARESAPTGISLKGPAAPSGEGASPARPAPGTVGTGEEAAASQKMTMEEAELLSSLSPPASSSAAGGEDGYEANSVTIDLTSNTCEVTVTAKLQGRSDMISAAQRVALAVARDVFALKPSLAGTTVRVFGDFPTPSKGEYGRLALIGYVRLGDQTRLERVWTNPYLQESAGG
jgi:hypothetical protein